MYLRAMFLISIALISIVLPNVAFAQANLFEPSMGDKSIEVLQALFGKLGVFNPGGGADAYTTDAFSGVVAVFNASVLIIGGVLVSYTILIGTIGTAHDGEMLGKKFSSAWVPIRTAMGTSLVLPVIGGSYCVMQAIVGWLVVQGVGLADAVWSAYVSSDNLSKQISLNISNYSKDYGVGWSIFSSAVCAYGYGEVVEEIRKQDRLAISDELAFGVTPYMSNSGASPEALISNSQIYYYGATTEGDGFKKDSCGQVSFSVIDSAPSGRFIPGAGSKVSPTNITLVDKEQIEKYTAESRAEQIKSFEEMRTSIENAAKDFVKAPNSVNAVNAVRTAVAKYSKSNADIGGKITSLLGNFKELESSASKDGWAFAGAWYMRMSYLMDAATSVMGKSPEATGADMSTKNIGGEFSDLFLSKYGNIMKELAKVSDGKTGVSGAAISQSATATSATSSSGWWDSLKSAFNLDSIVKKSIQSVGTWAVDDNDHPIIAMKQIGAWLLLLATTMFGSILAGLGLLGGVPFIGQSATAIAVGSLPFTMLVFPVLFTAGFTLQFIMPMMPFMLWIGVLLGWIILVVQAIIAAPMWAVMHLSPHGDDMVGTGGQGYRLVLSLMLRPVLMVFGLIAALTIITVFGKMVNGIFFSVFILSQQDTNLFSMIAAIVAAPILYLGLMWTLITKTMSLVHIMPDELLQWFGGQGQQLGDYGRTFGDRNSQTFAAAGATAALAGSALGAAKNAKDLSVQREQARLQNESLAGDQKARVNSSFLNGTGSADSSILENLSGSKDAEGQKKWAEGTNEGLAASAAMSDAVAKFGGPSEDSSNDYMSYLSENVRSGQTFNEAHANAMERTIGEHYGAEQAKYVSTATGGNFGTLGSKEAFRKAMSNVSSINTAYEKQPPHLRKENAERIFAATNRASGGIAANIQSAFESVISKEAGSTIDNQTQNVSAVVDRNFNNDQKPNLSGGQATSQD